MLGHRDTPGLSSATNQGAGPSTEPEVSPALTEINIAVNKNCVKTLSALLETVGFGGSLGEAVIIRI